MLKSGKIMRLSMIFPVALILENTKEAYVQSKYYSTVIQRVFNSRHKLSSKRNRAELLCVILLVFCSTLFADAVAVEDSCYIIGVISSGYDPLVGATVMVQGTVIGAMTDSEGRFTITTPPGEYQLVFSMVGQANRYILTEWIISGDTLDVGEVVLRVDTGGFHTSTGREFFQDTSIVVDMITGLDDSSLQAFAVFDGENRRKQMRHYIIGNGIVRFYTSRWRRYMAMWSLPHLGERAIEQVVFYPDSVNLVEIDTDVYFDSLVFNLIEHPFQIADATPDEWVAQEVTFDRKIYDTALFGQDSLVNFGFLGCQTIIHQDGSWKAVVGYCRSIALLENDMEPELFYPSHPLRKILFSPDGEYVLGTPYESPSGEAIPLLLYHTTTGDIVNHQPFQVGGNTVIGSSSGSTVITVRPNRIDYLADDGSLMSILSDTILVFKYINEPERLFRISELVPEPYAAFRPTVDYDHVTRSRDGSHVLIALQYRMVESQPSELLVCVDSSGSRMWSILGRRSRWVSSPNFERIACWNLSGVFSMHDGATANTLWKVMFENRPTKVIFSETGAFVAISSSDRFTGSFEIRESTNGTLLYSVQNTDWLPSIITDEGFSLLSCDRRFMLASPVGDPLWISPRRRTRTLFIKSMASNRWVELIYFDGRYLNVLSFIIQNEDPLDTLLFFGKSIFKLLSG